MATPCFRKTHYLGYFKTISEKKVKEMPPSKTYHPHLNHEIHHTTTSYVANPTTRVTLNNADTKPMGYFVDVISKVALRKALHSPHS